MPYSPAETLIYRRRHAQHEVQTDRVGNSCFPPHRHAFLFSEDNGNPHTQKKRTGWKTGITKRSAPRTVGGLDDIAPPCDLQPGKPSIQSRPVARRIQAIALRGETVHACSRCFQPSRFCKLNPAARLRRLVFRQRFTDGPQSVADPSPDQVWGGPWFRLARGFGLVAASSGDVLQPTTHI